MYNLSFSYPIEVVVSPPFIFLPLVKSTLRPDFHVAAQNCWVKKGGAFTGEVRYDHLDKCFKLSLSCLWFKPCQISVSLSYIFIYHYHLIFSLLGFMFKLHLICWHVNRGNAH